MEFIVQNALKTAESIGTSTENVGQANIKVIGCGGCGCNAAGWLFKKGIQGAEVILTNTDQQHLDCRDGDRKILIGKDRCRGLGAGGHLEVGAEAARESINELKEALRGSDMVFLCGGLGGGTGTGSLPVIAQICKEMGAITIGVVTMPFTMEKARLEKAEFGLKQLRQIADTVMVIDNNKISTIAGQLPIEQSFAVANELVSTMIKCIVETIALPSLINLDFADIQSIMKDGGVAAIGIGEDGSENRVEQAVKRALNNPLLDVNYNGATGAIVHITGGNDLTLEQAERIGDLATSALDKDAEVIWGTRIEPDFEGKVRVMTIITGVSSPYILGKVNLARPTPQAVQVNDDLGITMMQ